MDLLDFLKFTLPVISLELLAAIAGTYYLKKAPIPFKNSRFLVLFLWFTIFVELFGAYAPIAYFSGYEILASIKDTPFENNLWWFNIFILINIIFFTYYFISFLRNKTVKTIAYICLVMFFIASVGVYATSVSIFKVTSNFVIITGTILLLLSVLLFYFELLRSDLLLQLKYFLPFYISVGVLVFNLSVAPLDILSNYFSLGDGNRLFVKFQINVILYANIFLYSSFILGFLICSKKREYLF